MPPAEVQLELAVDCDGFIAASEFAEIITQVERMLWGASLESAMRKIGRPTPFFTVGLTSAGPGGLRLAGVVSSAVVAYNDKLIRADTAHAPEMLEEVERFIREDLPGKAQFLEAMVARDSIPFARTSLTRIRGIRILLNRPGESPPVPAPTPAAPLSAADFPLDLAVEFEGFIAGRELVEIIEAVERGIEAEYREVDPYTDGLLRLNRLPFFYLYATKGPPFTLQGFIGSEAAGYGLQIFNRVDEREHDYAKRSVAQLVEKIRANPARFVGNINAKLGWTAANDQPSNLRLARVRRDEPHSSRPSPTFIFGPRFPGSEPRAPG